MEPFVSRVFGAAVRVSVAVAMAVTVLSVSAGPAVAECDGPVPSFGDALSSAKRIVIGDVVAVQSGGLVEPGPNARSSRFTLRVRYVLRGEAPPVMSIRDLATQPCAPGVEARIGDRIALALDATDFTPPMQVNTAAWIRGTPPSYNETIAAVDIFHRLGQDAPDTAMATPVPAPASSLAPLLSLVAGFVGFILGWKGIRSPTPFRVDRAPAQGAEGQIG